MDKITVDDITIAYSRSGDGPQAVIVMHGWGCTGATVQLLADAATALGKTTVYNLDLPGFGESPEPPAGWGVYDYAHCIEAFADALGIVNPVLIGHSYGGRIAIVYASERPVRKLILVDSAGIKPRRSMRYYLKVYSFKTAKKMLPFIVGKSRAAQITDRMRGKAGSVDYAAASPVMRQIMSRSVNQDLRHHLPQISAPTLLIWGENDTATPLADAKLMEKNIPDAGLVSYPGCGHYSFLDRPGQTVAVIKSFLNL